MPFTYKPGLTSDAIEYVGIYVFLLVLICTFILVPVFSSDSQTQADQILKCTRDGKKCLAVSRILAGLLLTGILYLVCMTLFLLLLNASSLTLRVWILPCRLLVSVSVFLPLTAGQMELLIAGAGSCLPDGHGCFHALPLRTNENRGFCQYHRLCLSPGCL